MNCEQSWLPGHIFELGVDGFGYIVNESESKQSHPFNVSKLEARNGRHLPLEGASVRYLIHNSKITKVKLLETFIAE